MKIRIAAILFHLVLRFRLNASGEKKTLNLTATRFECIKWYLIRDLSSMVACTCHNDPPQYRASHLANTARVDVHSGRRLKGKHSFCQKDYGECDG